MKAQRIILEKSNSVSTEANGLIGVNPNKPEYGSIQMRTKAYNFGSFAASKSKVHFLAGSIDDLKEIIADFGLKIGDDWSAKVQPSRIITKEQTTPYYDGQNPKVNPSTGEELTKDGENIYMKTFLVTADSKDVDVLIDHDRDTVASNVESPFVEDELSA